VGLRLRPCCLRGSDVCALPAQCGWCKGHVKGRCGLAGSSVAARSALGLLQELAQPSALGCIPSPAARCPTPSQQPTSPAGSKLILGLNFERENLTLTKAQLDTAKRKLPSGSILAFEIGNEVRCAARLLVCHHQPAPCGHQGLCPVTPPPPAHTRTAPPPPPAPPPTTPPPCSPTTT